MYVRENTPTCDENNPPTNHAGVQGLEGPQISRNRLKERPNRPNRHKGPLGNLLAEPPLAPLILAFHVNDPDSSPMTVNSASTSTTALQPSFLAKKGGDLHTSQDITLSSSRVQLICSIISSMLA